jgi:hypothetical protein
MNAKARTTLRLLLPVVLLLLVAAQFFPGERTNPPTDPAGTLHARVEVPAEVGGILERACADCHSHATRWPWYSNVAPVSWWVIGHVDHARSHLNFSAWPADPGRSRELLANICEDTRSGRMPLGDYLRMHAGARLSPADVAALCAWNAGASASLPGGR